MIEEADGDGDGEIDFHGESEWRLDTMFVLKYLCLSLQSSRG